MCPLCSAGIGRTGVFMLMETALCKMEVLEPIYPLEIVRAMRDQRGMLVQTPVSAHSLDCSAVNNQDRNEIKFRAALPLYTVILFRTSR